MQFKLPSFTLLLGILGLCTLVQGLAIPGQGVSVLHQVARRGFFESLAAELDPRRLGGGLGSLGKSKPKPAPAPAPKPAPAPAPKPAPAPAKPAPSKAAPAPVKQSQAAKPPPASSKKAAPPASSAPPPPASKSAQQASAKSQASAQSQASVASQASAKSQASAQSQVVTSAVQASSSLALQSSSLATSISTATSAVPVPRKCTTNTCGSEACPVAVGTQDDDPAPSAAAGAANTTLAKRAFFDMAGNGATEKLANKKGNRDASSFKNRNTAFIPFNGKDRKSITVVGLEGCTVVCAFSDKGMVVAHMFESVAPDASGKADITDTLHPTALDATLAKVKTTLAANKAQLAGGQLVLMLPMNPAKGKQNLFKYDSEVVNPVNPKTGKFDTTQVISSEGVVDDIRQMATSATGLKITKEIQYIPPLTNAEALANAQAKSPKGTFAIQYDPNNGPEDAAGNAVQVFAEGTAQLAQPFTFETSA